MDKIRYLLNGFYEVAYIDGEDDCNFDPSASQYYTLLLDLFTRMKNTIEELEKAGDGKVFEEAFRLLKEIE